MEWIERFNNVINYIEENITQQIDYGEIAKIACCSSYHFQRMFTYMAGIPLSEYIRKRKGTGRAGQAERPHDCRWYHAPADQV
ncbi:hypothetical protein Selli2_02290 [Sellimonas catena]|uniref:HTH araC/xylS-type domain-containing protein n=1 Tax=Sellimonas catena TaxID=2994035 RepID=A0A9W6C7I8_9FIRM|nr:hypothetical protein Selli2_02290 [Sellimonas catena]